MRLAKKEKGDKCRLPNIRHLFNVLTLPAILLWYHHVLEYIIISIAASVIGVGTALAAVSISVAGDGLEVFNHLRK